MALPLRETGRVSNPAEGDHDEGGDGMRTGKGVTKIPRKVLKVWYG